MDGNWAAAHGAHHFVGNRWVAPNSDQTIDVIDPSDGGSFARIARGNAADIDAAVTAARARWAIATATGGA
jgi:aldehyde dehydrogenase (NAD+)